MRDLLVPIFGEWAVVAQFLLTVVIVLGLIGAVWWFMRRYSGVHFGGIGRGRVPRLAVVDVMQIDRRRRLVLVRRDTVEHLILIGGPSDLVVEGAIQRTRQRSAQQAAQVAAARAAMQSALEAPPAAEPEAPEAAGAEQPPANAPIPFPVGRTQAAGGNGRSQRRPVQQPPAEAAPVPEAPAAPAALPVAASASFVEPQRPTEVRPMPAAAPQPPQPQVPEEPAAEALLPEVMTAEAEALPASPPAQAATGPATFAEAEWEAAEEARQSALDLGEVDVPATASGDEEMAAGQPQAAPAAAPGEEGPEPPESTARVSDLEREMARLLDEITTRRTS